MLYGLPLPSPVALFGIDQAEISAVYRVGTGEQRAAVTGRESHFAVNRFPGQHARTDGRLEDHVFARLVRTAPA